jgi:hypothetical protein
MKALIIALVLTVLASSAASAFTETFELNIFRPAIPQKSIGGYGRVLPGEEPRAVRRAPKPPTATERSLFQRLFRPE